MKKYIILLSTALLFCKAGFAQVVSVTGGTNTTPNLAATYTSLANAITALNTITVISGPVSIRLNAGNPQTAPAGGYVIQFTATTTAANLVEIYGTGNNIQAFTPQASGSLNDAIFKLVGVDHVYIIFFNMVENPFNSTTAVATNNMTEWGIALLRASQTNGSQYNHILYNNISLNRSYRNTFGIYSNVLHAPATPTVSQDITSAAGSNSYDTFLNNTITNVGYGIVFIGSLTPAFMDNGNDIGGTSSFTANTFTNWGGNATVLSSYVQVNSNSYCIEMMNQLNDNISYNTISSATVSGATFVIGGIIRDYSAVPTGTIATTISYNTITLSSANLSGNMTGITTQGMTIGLSTSTLTVNNNSIINCVLSGAGTISSFTGILNGSYWGLLHIRNNLVKGNTSTATGGSFYGIANYGQVTDTINITDNTLGDNVSGPISFSAATTGTFNGIFNFGAASTATINIVFNKIDKVAAVTTGQFNGIYNNGASGVAVNITSNFLGLIAPQLVTFSGVQTAAVVLISNQNTTAGCVVNISNSWIRGIIHTSTAFANHQYILNSAPCNNITISDNQFENLSVNTTGSVTFITKSGAMASGGTSTVTNNRINTAFNKTAAGSQVCFYTSTGASVNGSSMTETGNNFSNVTVTGATQILGWSNTEGVSAVSGPTKTITGNTFTAIANGTGATAIIRTDLGAATDCSSNTITNITGGGGGSINGIIIMANNGSGTHNYASNTISGLVSSGTGGDVRAITGGAAGITILNINNHNISTLSSTGASATITGIEVTGGTTVNINNNSLGSFTGTGTASPLANGLVVSGGTNVNVFLNYIYNVAQNGTISTTSPAVNGMLFSGGTNVTAYNNFVSNMRAPAASLTDAVRIVSVTSTTPSSSYKLYYNSINAAATSSGANFGTTALYHAASATGTTASLNLKDNIICNTSTPNGTGLAVAFRRSGTALNNYATGSDYNDFYGGVPSATRLIYHDGTNADQTFGAFQTRVSTREINSLGVQPFFPAPTDLHLWSNLNCRLDGRGTPIPGITTDIDNTSRDAVKPDMGADEFNPFYFLNTLAGVNGTAVCENKTIASGPTTFAANTACNLIATVQSSGADPVSGVVNACVTLDATQQFFNAEPYVQRHYDIEPVTSNTTTTSATLTLYFTDAEFTAFNTNNPTWPQLPTLAGGGNADPNIANLKVTQYHGTPTTTPSTPGNYTANAGSGTLINPADANIVWNNWYWAVTFNVTGFSGFYVHTNLYYPLPVSINYFKGIKQSGDHLLSWKINCNNSPAVGITLEKSDNARSGFSALASFSPDALRCTQPFDHRDAAPLKGMNYYRLKIRDADGKISYSSTIALLNASTGVELISIAPNPVDRNALLTLGLTTAKAGSMQLIISDMQGRLVQQQYISMTAGYNNILLDTKKLSPGTYHLRGITEDENTKTIRFVIR